MALKSAYQEFDTEAKEALEWFQGEISGLRTGRVTPALVEKIQAEHYGARTPLKGLATISSSDGRTLMIAPWDEAAIPTIEKALTDAQLGVNPTVDGNVIRLGFPSLTEEMRQQTIRQLNSKAEETRVRLRKARDEALNGIKREQKSGNLTEDDMYDGKKELNERIDSRNKDIEDIVEKKEADISQM
jgi:ribosome recycling factor